MGNYVAYYRSPAAADQRGAGSFAFESNGRRGTKENLHDARVRMLELFGKDAASWNIERIERKTASNEGLDGQMSFDFRPPKKRRKRRTKEYW